jgi:hypothetical protein
MNEFKFMEVFIVWFEVLIFLWAMLMNLNLHKYFMLFKIFCLPTISSATQPTISEPRELAQA